MGPARPPSLHGLHPCHHGGLVHGPTEHTHTDVLGGEPANNPHSRWLLLSLSVARASPFPRVSQDPDIEIRRTDVNPLSKLKFAFLNF